MSPSSLASTLTPAGPVAVVALPLVAAVLWGLAPTLSKRALSLGATPLQGVWVVLALDTVFYWVGTGLTEGTAWLSTLGVRSLATFVVAGLVGTALGRLAVYAGIERLGAAVNTAALASRPLFATALAFALLGERVTATTGVGVLVLVGGLAALALTRGGEVRGWTPRHLLFPIAGAAAFAVGSILRRYGMQSFTLGPLAAVTLNETTALVAVTAYVAVRGRLGRLTAIPHDALVRFVGSAVCTTVGFLAVFVAYDHPAGRVATVDPLIATAPLFAAGFTYLLLDDLERVTRGVVAGAVLVVAGAALVTVST